MSLPPAVLWIDPGKMTGLAIYYRAEQQFYCMEDDFLIAGDHIETLCSRWRHNLWVGWEQFTIGPRTPAIDAHHAIEMIGVARRAALQGHCLILPAAPPEQRKMATQKMLEALGWWVPAKDDAQSAAQHLLGWMMRTGNEPSYVAVKLAALRTTLRETMMEVAFLPPPCGRTVAHAAHPIQGVGDPDCLGFTSEQSSIWVMLDVLDQASLTRVKGTVRVSPSVYHALARNIRSPRPVDKLFSFPVEVRGSMPRGLWQLVIAEGTVE